MRTGGFFAIGFGENTDLALVSTHDGRGLIDCETGTRIARDYDLAYPDEDTLVLEGIGALAGKMVSVAGEDGGELPKTTDDGWRLEGTLANNSEDVISLLPPTPDMGNATFSGFVPEIRVFGFSPTGRSFIIATGAEVFVYGRV